MFAYGPVSQKLKEKIKDFGFTYFDFHKAIMSLTILTKVHTLLYRLKIRVSVVQIRPLGTTYLVPYGKFNALCKRFRL